MLQFLRCFFQLSNKGASFLLTGRELVEHLPQLLVQPLLHTLTTIYLLLEAVNLINEEQTVNF